MDNIEVRGARTHNLKNINLIIPRDKLIVVTGLSGSGKSSLAFDTLYAEGQRRAIESLSAYARQFLSLMEKPDVDQKVCRRRSPSSRNPPRTTRDPRSAPSPDHDYLRLLFARVGEPRCRITMCRWRRQTVSQMVDNVLSQPEGKRLMLLAPVVKSQGEHAKRWENTAAQGYIRARIDGEVCDLSDPPKLELQRNTPSKWWSTVSRCATTWRSALADRSKPRWSCPVAPRWWQIWTTKRTSCCFPPASPARSAATARELEPRLFSFNNPAGACPTCDGTGVQQFFDPDRVVQNPRAVAGRRRDPRLGSPQLLTSRCCARWRAL